MRFRRQLLLIPLAFAGILGSVAPADAIGPVFRQRTVIRGKGWGSPGIVLPAAPVGAEFMLGPVGVREFGLAPVGFTSFGVREFAFAPLGRETFTVRDARGDAREMAREVAREFFRQAPEFAPEANIVSGKGTAAPAATTPAGTAVCNELRARMDKIDERLGALSSKLGDIEKKVDHLLAEKQQQQEVEQLRLVVDQVVARRLNEQNQRYLPLFRALAPSDAAQKQKYEELLKALEGK